MFGPLGLPELIFIFVLALLIFGPKRLPEVGRTVGKGLAEFRKASADLRRTINAELIDEEVRAADPRKIVRDSLRDVKKGLDPDPRKPDAKTSDAQKDAPGDFQVAADPADPRGPRAPTVATPQTPVDVAPSPAEPALDSPTADAPADSSAVAPEPAGAVARGAFRRPSADPSDSETPDDGASKGTEGKP